MHSGGGTEGGRFGTASVCEGGLPALDGLRGLAALIVFVSHYSNAAGLFAGKLGIGAGQTGVMLFFMLSGFLMAHLYITSRFDLAAVSVYGLKRFARVYPLFVIAAALPQVLAALNFPGEIAMAGISSPEAFLRQVLLLDRGVGVFWTIRVEIIFYAAFIALWAVMYFWGVWVALVISLAVSVLSVYASIPATVSLVPYVHYFSFGVISSLLLNWFKRPCGRVGSLVALLLLLSIPLTFPLVAGHLFGAEILPWRRYLVMAQVVLLFNFALRDQHWLRTILASRPARWLGGISYAVYLLHLFVLDPVLKWIGPEFGHPLRFSVCLTISLLLAMASTYFVERPLQGFLLALPGRFRRRPAVPTA